jgi:threonine synthase
MAADPMATACPNCGSQWLNAKYDYSSVQDIWREGLLGRIPSLWRYQELIPLSDYNPEISMYEGFTPLFRLYAYQRIYDHPALFLKDERQGPTSSFKDRQAAVAVTALKRAGVTECVLASTGNAGAAYAAYCARAGIKLWLFLTAQVPGEKMREAALYGAEVVRVSGSYDEAKHLAAEFARHKGLHFDRGARAIPGKESMKTLGFEIAEQLGLQYDEGRSKWRAPDWYVQAVSGGIGPLGVWKGFHELYQMGLTDRMPKLGIIQAAGCAPMVHAFEHDLPTATRVEPQTLIHVLATGEPGFAYVQLRKAIASFGGTMLQVEDGEAFSAMRRLASTAGLSVEPATAVAFAGLEKMLYEGIIDSDEVVVVNCSGHTFPAESHILGDQYLLNLELSTQSHTATPTRDGALIDAFANLDEQVTTILVVDDNPNDRRLLRRLLKAQKNYRVFEAKSGREALRLMNEHMPDLILSDLTMPEMDGITFIEQMKWNPETAHIPIMVISAKMLTDADRITLSKYAHSVWLKGDFDMKSLLYQIVQVLEQSTGETKETWTLDDINNALTNDVSPGYHFVLIEADNERETQLRQFLQRIQANSIVCVTSGREGLKAIYEHQPDIVLLSADTPDMGSLSVVETLRKDSRLRQTPVIIYTTEPVVEDDWQQAVQLQVLVMELNKLKYSNLPLMINQAVSLVR